MPNGRSKEPNGDAERRRRRATLLAVLGLRALLFGLVILWLARVPELPAD